MASQFGTAWEQLLDFDRLRNYRSERLQRVMTDEGLDAVVVFRHDNIRYLTGYRPLMWETGYVTRNAAILARGGRPVVLAHAGDLDRARAGMPWMRREELLGLGSMEDPGIAKTIVESTFRDLLEPIQSGRGKIGLDGTTLFTTTFLRAALPRVQWRDGAAPLKRARAVKSQDEVKLISIAAEIADAGLAAALEHVDSDGMTDQRAAAEGVRAIFALGAEYLPVNPVVTSGAYAATYYPLTAERLITPGGFVILDFSALHDGYCARVARTVFVGRPSATQQALYRQVHAALDRGIEYCRAGTPAALVASQVRAALPGVDQGAYVYGRGAGVGLSVREFPLIREESADILEPGMVIALEVGVHIPDQGGVRLCETLAITDAAPQRLTKLRCDKELLTPGR